MASLDTLLAHFGSGRFLGRGGTFVAIAIEPAASYYRPALDPHKPFAAVHDGLTTDEMVVSLIIA